MRAFKRKCELFIEIQQLLDLNAELLQALIEILPSAKKWMGDDHSLIKWAESIVAKAEAMK